MINEERKRQAKDYSILDLAQRLGIELDRNNFCRCIHPNHEDRHPSMLFDKKNNIFKCFSCGFKGDTIELVMKYKNIDFTEAINFILGFGYTKIPLLAQETLLKRSQKTILKILEKMEQIMPIFMNILLIRCHFQIKPTILLQIEK